MIWTVEVHPKDVKFIQRKLAPDDQVSIQLLFEQLELHGTELNRPYTRQIERELWELRPQHTIGTWWFLYVLDSSRRFLIVVGMRKGKITRKLKKTARQRVAYFEEGD